MALATINEEFDPSSLEFSAGFKGGCSDEHPIPFLFDLQEESQSINVNFKSATDVHWAYSGSSSSVLSFNQYTSVHNEEERAAAWIDTIDDHDYHPDCPYMGGTDMQQAVKKLCNNNRKAKANYKPSPSKDPQSIAAKNRRERISERLKVLQELVPNGTKVDLVTMLEKAYSYVKFLQLQVKVLAADEFWPAQGGKAPEVAQVKDAIDAILSSSSIS